MILHESSENILAQILLDYDSGQISAVDVCVIRKRLEEVVRALKYHDKVIDEASKMIGKGTEKHGIYYLKVHKYLDSWGNTKKDIWVWKDPYKELR